MRSIPNLGIDYLLLSDSLNKNTDILFNFFNNSASNNELFAFYADSSIFSSSLNVSCTLSSDSLSFELVAPEGMHNSGITTELGSEFVKQFENLLELCTTSDKVTKTCSDFSDNELSQTELDELLDLFDWTDDNE